MKLCKLLFLANVEKHVMPGPEGDAVLEHSDQLPSFRVVNRIWALEFLSGFTAELVV